MKAKFKIAGEMDSGRRYRGIGVDDRIGSALGRYLGFAWRLASCAGTALLSFISSIQCSGVGPDLLAFYRLLLE